MLNIKYYSSEQRPTDEEKNEIIDFLFKHLEQFGDPRGDIEKSVGFALKEYESFGGFLLASYDEDQITGAVIMNRTGMKDYIPENILVYIATHREYRGKGIGKALMMEAINNSDGNVALHVEPDNPARFLYEKVGFSTKYQEMRYKRN